MPYMQLGTFSNLVPHGSQLGKIHALSKVHKEDTPLRSVLSMIEQLNITLLDILQKI